MSATEPDGWTAAQLAYVARNCRARAVIGPRNALERLTELILSATKVEKKRRPTKPTLGSKKRRLEGKSQRGSIKAGRGKVDY